MNGRFHLTFTELSNVKSKTCPYVLEFNVLKRTGWGECLHTKHFPCHMD